MCIAPSCQGGDGAGEGVDDYEPDFGNRGHYQLLGLAAATKWEDGATRKPESAAS
jgi:hypothetical protein